MGSNAFFLQVVQQGHKKMHPAKPVPKSENELMESGLSMTSYMERFGGFKNKHESGMLMWLLCHAMDAGSTGNHQLMNFFFSRCAKGFKPGH